MKRATILTLLLLAVAAGPYAQERPQAFVGATIIPIEGAPITDGTLVVHAGKIVAVGPSATTSVPPQAGRRDVRGMTIMPGLVDTHSHIGEAAGADRTSPIQPEVRVLDAVNVRDAGLQKAQAGGITTVNIMPGSGHLISGQTIYLKLRDGETLDDLAIRNRNGGYAGGLKMANGTNPLGDPPFPGTRSKSAALVRAQFLKALDYRDKIRKAGSATDKLPPRDLALDVLVEVLEGRMVVHHHTHRHDDIMTVLRLAKEFGFRVVLHHVSEGWKVAEEIAAAKVPASIIVIDSPGGKLEAQDLLLFTGAALERAGVDTAFHTDDGITDSRLFLRSAALAVRYGMSREKALEALTLAGARMLGLEQHVGSLRAGKDADFILLSGDPLSTYTHVVETWVDGTRVFNRNDPKDRLFAVGGYGASRDQVIHLDENELGGDL